MNTGKLCEMIVIYNKPNLWVISMERTEAIFLISLNRLKELNIEAREEMLLNWWGIDEEDVGFLALPNTLQTEILNNEIYTSNASETKYDPLIIEGLKKQYYGVKSEYIRDLLMKFGYDETIEGEVEELFSCPCCNYRSLPLHGEYDICKVCFWEDDGTNELSIYSSVNKLTLTEGQNNFMKLGASHEIYLSSIDLEGPKKYIKVDERLFKEGDHMT